MLLHEVQSVQPRACPRADVVPLRPVHTFEPKLQHMNSQPLQQALITISRDSLRGQQPEAIDANVFLFFLIALIGLCGSKGSMAIQPSTVLHSVYEYQASKGTPGHPGMRNMCYIRCCNTRYTGYSASPHYSVIGFGSSSEPDVCMRPRPILLYACG